MKYHEIAVEVLRETDNPAVMWGDAGLLDMIYYRKNGYNEKHPYQRWKAVLDALTKAPGRLTPKYTLLPNGRTVRLFELQTEAVEGGVTTGMKNEQKRLPAEPPI